MLTNRERSKQEHRRATRQQWVERGFVGPDCLRDGFELSLHAYLKSDPCRHCYCGNYCDRAGGTPIPREWEA